MADKTFKVKVVFTEQQIKDLDKLKKEAKWGKNYGEIVAAVFHEHVRSTLGRGGV